MLSVSEFTHNAIEVCSRLDDEKLAALCDILAVVMVSRSVSPRLGFIGCASFLRDRADAHAEHARPIFSTDCAPRVPS